MTRATLGRAAPATVVADGDARSCPALLRATPGRLVLADGSGSARTFTAGEDVESLTLRRATPERGSAWVLDLMRDGRSVARLTAPPWRFDRRTGPAALAEVAGVPLVQRAPMLAEDPRPVLPGRQPGWLLVLLALSYAAVLWFVSTLLFTDGVSPTATAVCAALALLPLVAYRLRARFAQGEVVLRARPSVPVPRTFRRSAAVRRRDGLLVIGNGTESTYALPDSVDVLGPRALRPGRLPKPCHQPVERVALTTADGTVLVHLSRSEWCGDGSEVDLAGALGVAWDPTPLPELDLAERGLGTAGLPVLDPQPLLVPGLLGILTLIAASADRAPADPALRWTAVLFGAAAACLGPLVSVGLLAGASRKERLVTPRPTEPAR